MGIKKNLFMLLVLCSLAGQGCLATKSAVNASSSQPLMMLEKTACLGQCPTFLLMVYENGSVVFKPKKHTLIDTMGEHTISDQQLAELREVFEAKFPSLDTNYVGPIMDAPFAYLSYRTGENTKKVSSRGPVPASFQYLVNLLESVAADAEWLPRKTEDGRETVEIIIELIQDATPEEFLNDLSEFEPTLVKRITPSKSYYLFSITAENPEVALIEIRGNSLVVNAQWNHKLKKRDQ